MIANTKKIVAFGIGILFANIAMADDFVSLEKKKNNSVKHTLAITPLTAFDESFRQKAKKYPKNTSFYIDARTGQIISINRTPPVKRRAPVSVAKPIKKAPQNTQKKAMPNNYQMQEERIELLQ